MKSSLFTTLFVWRKWDFHLKEVDFWKSFSKIGGLEAATPPPHSLYAKSNQPVKLSKFWAHTSDQKQIPANTLVMVWLYWLQECFYYTGTNNLTRTSQELLCHKQKHSGIYLKQSTCHISLRAKTDCFVWLMTCSQAMHLIGDAILSALLFRPDLA